jgi:CubicO group peptidase (beta-lactamase class C family)
MAGGNRLGAVRGVVAATLVASVALAATAHARTVRCELPRTGDFATAGPTTVDLDPAKVRAAIDYASTRNALSVRVYRNGCLVGRSALDPTTESTPNDVWSTTKGVVSLLVGRAQQLGYLQLDDPISKFALPATDAAHGAITVRQLLTESSGLHFNWPADLNMAADDDVRFTLALPFDRRPGTYFEYAQTTITLLLSVIEHAVHEDVQTFAQRELFTPLGIPRDDWFWLRDRAGNTQGWAHLFLPPKYLARFGYLLLRDGRWRGRRLISSAYAREVHEGTAPNHAYGYLLWSNAGDSAVTPSIPARKVIPGPRPLIKSAPDDMFAFIGANDQDVFVIPSLDMVVVRTGLGGNQTKDPQTAVTANTGDWLHEFFRTLMSGVRDHHFDDPGPYVDRDPVLLDPAYFVDPVTLAASMGVGPGAAPGCNPTGCDGRVDMEGYAQTLADAVRALAHTAR